MRIVDFHAFPDRSDLRAELLEAFDEIDPGDGERADPIEDGAALGIGFPDDLSDDEIRDRATDLRTQLEAIVSEEFTVRFEVADGPSDTAGGAPDHVE